MYRLQPLALASREEAALLVRWIRAGIEVGFSGPDGNGVLWAYGLFPLE